MTASRVDVVVVGAGPNGLAAAIELGRAGLAVRILEASETAGGGTRSAELTLPGFVHDVCSTAHPLGIASPFFRSLDLGRRGLSWVHSEAPMAHMLAPDRAVLLERSVEETAAGMGRDGGAWRRLFGPLVHDVDRLLPALLGPVVRPPRHPVALARFGLPALLPATGLARVSFREPAARALFAGLAAHSMVALGRPMTASFGLVLGMLAHAVGWPFARGGSGRIADALIAEGRALDVEIVTGARVASLADVPPASATVFDLTPRQVVGIAGARLTARYRRSLTRFRYGPGIFKIDWALDGPIPWGDPAAARAGTVHVGGTMEDVAAWEGAVAAGQTGDRPFVLVVQASRFDPSRAPAGKHTAWAYCHVPNGSTADMTGAIEAQVERFAPGFRDLVLARATKDSAELEAYDANYVGGDINGGIQDWRQLIFRPDIRWDPYRMPADGFYLCSSSTPPGGGVHGMCGSLAARSVLRGIGVRARPQLGRGLVPLGADRYRRPSQPEGPG
jgi:phytoene dehydrogenase-like protein